MEEDSAEGHPAQLLKLDTLTSVILMDIVPLQFQGTKKGEWKMAGVERRKGNNLAVLREFSTWKIYCCKPE
jgi:hypothetical protein